MTAPFRFYSINHPSQRQWAAALDDFAELESLDLPLPEIARRMEVSNGTVCVLRRLLCELMGEPA